MDELAGDPLGPPEPERGTPYGGVPKFRPAWVNVAALFPAPAPPRPLAVDGLDMSVGEAPGVVHFWTRASHGLWIACCSYTLRHIDGRDRPYRVDRQLVPETALRQRSVGH